MANNEVFKETSNQTKPLVFNDLGLVLDERGKIVDANHREDINDIKVFVTQETTTNHLKTSQVLEASMSVILAIEIGECLPTM